MNRLYYCTCDVLGVTCPFDSQFWGKKDAIETAEARCPAHRFVEYLGLCSHMHPYVTDPMPEDRTTRGNAMPTKKEILNALTTIKLVCDITEDCEYCPLRADDNVNCGVTEDTPDSWPFETNWRAFVYDD